MKSYSQSRSSIAPNIFLAFSTTCSAKYFYNHFLFFAYVIPQIHMQEYGFSLTNILPVEYESVKTRILVYFIEWLTNYLACTISKPRSFMKFSHKQYQFFSETVRKRHWQSSHHTNSEFIFSSFVYSLIQGLKFVQRLVWYYQHLTVTFQLFKFLAAMEFEDAILLIGLLLYGIET